LESILQVHQRFWMGEKLITYAISLLNAVPDAVPAAEKMIKEAYMSTLKLDLLLLVQ